MRFIFLLGEVVEVPLFWDMNALQKVLMLLGNCCSRFMLFFLLPFL